MRPVAQSHVGAEVQQEPAIVSVISRRDQEMITTRHVCDRRTRRQPRPHDRHQPHAQSRTERPNPTTIDVRSVPAAYSRRNKSRTDPDCPRRPPTRHERALSTACSVVRSSLQGRLVRTHSWHRDSRHNDAAVTEAIVPGHGRVAVPRAFVFPARSSSPTPYGSSGAAGDVGVALAGLWIIGATRPSAARGETSGPRRSRERRRRRRGRLHLQASESHAFAEDPHEAERAGGPGVAAPHHDQRRAAPLKDRKK